MTVAVPPIILLDLRNALADALRTWWDDVFATLIVGLRKAVPDDDDTLTQLQAAMDVADDDFAETLQSNAVISPLASAYTNGSTAAEAEVGIVWGLKNRFALDWARQRAAEMVGMRRLESGRLVPNPSAAWRIDTTTRQALRDAVTEMLTAPGYAGGSWRDLQEQIEHSPAFGGQFGEYRAEMIARTETALAANAGTVGTYKQAGITHVLVLDNPLCPICGPFANTLQTVEWWKGNPIGHPNCIRSAYAVIPHPAMQKDEGGPSAGPPGPNSSVGITTGLHLTGVELEGQDGSGSKKTYPFPINCDPRCPKCRGQARATCICPEEAACRSKS